MKFKEWHRTVILVVLLIVALALLYWLKHSYSTNFTDTLGR